MSKKPTPPPLDDEQAAAHGGDAPLAESGKATAEDAAAANARAAADARAAAAPPPADDVKTKGRGKPAPDVAPDDDRPRALISNASGIFVARPHPSEPISLTAPVVVGNWYGSHEGKPAHVKHGTPLDELPSELVDAIVNTRNQVVGPLPVRQPQNPFTP